MVAIFTGLGAGFERGSGSVLGGAGLLGGASLGRNGEQLFLNAATGNLLISQRDEFLVGRGPDAAISRTYNSLGDLSDENGDNWRQSTDRRVYGLTGSVNGAGSTVRRVSADGSDILYSWNGGAYVATDGAGAYDTLTYSGGTWTWTDGSSQVRETYEAYGSYWRISQQVDTDGNALAFTYTGAALTRITTANGEYIDYSWSGSNITGIVTQAGGTLTRTRYGYDGYNRLTTVTVDLSPSDNSIADGKTYVTSYAYHGTSKFVASITQSDGSSIAIGYDGSNRVTSLTQTVASGVTRTTTIGYNAGYTTVTDATGQVTTLEYHGDGSLKKITAPPAYAGAAAQIVQFGYNGNGDVTSVTDAAGATSWMSYDGMGNLVSQTDRLGNLVTRTYGAKNELLTETTTGSDAGSSAASHTVRYAYDSESHLTYKVSAEGSVTKYTYTAAGQLAYIQHWTVDTYDLSGLGTNVPITEAQLETWRNGIADWSQITVLENGYDARGALQQTTSYSYINSAGVVLPAEGYTRSVFAYDQAGNLLSRYSDGHRYSDGGVVIETFVYDGMGRMVSAVDLKGGTTSFVFNDASTSTVVTLASGLVQTSTYDKAGELIAFTESGSFVAGGTASYKYDQNGRLRQMTDANGFNTYYLYDKVGRKTAEVNHYGWVTEYRYDARDRLVATGRYALGTSGAMAQLADPNANVEIASFRPADHPYDIWTWQVYDQEGRVIEAIDGDGGVTAYDYDASGRLVRTTTYANKLTAAQISSFKASAPAALVLPTADAAKDSVARSFYNKDGRLIGVLDGEGYLSRIFYDRAGQKTEEVAYFNATSAALRASGTFNQLFSSIAAHANDRRTRYVYDGQGQLRYQVDGQSQVTEFVYDTAGQATQTIRYAGSIAATSNYTYDNVKALVASSGLAGNAATRRSWAVYDPAGRLAYGIDASGAVTGYTYDNMGQVTKTVQFATVRATSSLPAKAVMDAWAGSVATASDHIVRHFYTARGELRFTVDAEGYVTRYDYDAGGRTTAEIRWDTAIAINDSATIATVNGAVSGTYRSNSYYYDLADKLAYAYDGEGNYRYYGYYATGERAWDIAMPNHADESRILYVYDAAGRVIAEYKAYGQPEQAVTQYGYDGHGNLISIIDPNGNVTNRAYDKLGRMVSQTDALSGTIAYEYNAFDEAVKVTDARGNASYNYYDNLGRVTATRDAEGYVTETSYTVFGDVAGVTRRYNQANNAASVGTLPTYAAHAKDAVTSFEYDKLSRMVKTTDAEGYYEQYTLDAFGNRTSVRNKLGGITTNGYDRRGLLTSETLPMASVDANGNSVASTVTNRFEYDARGNRTKRIEAYGLAEQRTTTYVYDKADRLTETRGDAVSILSQGDHATLSSVTPTERVKYDTRGNVVETVDANGARTLFYYDKLNRKIAEISAVGTMSTYTYDKNGNVLTSRVYGTAVALPATAGGTAPGAPGGDYRETSYSYDKLNRLKTTSIAGIRTGSWNGTYYATSLTTLTTSLDYDANGNVVRTTDGNGGAVFSYYDKLGRKTRQVDPEGYVTGWVYDAEGNVTYEQRWALKTGYAGLDGAWDPAAHQNDRVTSFTYDRNGRRVSEQRMAVAAGAVSSTGGLSTTVQNATIYYQYNGLGQVTRKTEATGDFVDYAYDASGRLAQEVRAPYADQTGATVRPSVRYYYDGLNNLVQTRQGGEATAAGDRITRYAYGAGGRMATMTDANGATYSYYYDAAGNQLRESYYRLKSDGSSSWDHRLVSRDILGRVTSQRLATWLGYWQNGDTQDMAYNAYGEVAQRGVNGGWQEQFAYDGAGRLWRSNSGDGVWRYFVNDGAGNRTLTIESEGTDLANLTIDQALAVATANGAYYVGGAYIDGINATIGVFDKRGQQTATREPFRQLTASTTQTLASARTYNAFGEVTSETDARGYTTDFAYNNMGRLIEKKSPTVSYTGENGVVSSARPTETYYYDFGGRMVGVRDANNNLVTRALLAGTGYNGSEALVTADFHADGGVFRTYYDMFGDARILRDELGQDEGRLYDAMGRLVQLTHRGSLLTDNYAYDLLGQRIQHWNSMIGFAGRETTDYDVQGRVTRQVTFGGTTTSTSYAWNSAIATSGMGTYGGWTKTTTHASGTSSSENLDLFGRTVAKTDLGGRSYSYNYDKAGRLTSQTGPSGQSMTTSYFNTGRAYQIADYAGWGLNSITATFGYDAGGNRTYEGYAGTVYAFSHVYGATSAYQTLQNATIDYDALGRITAFTDRDAYGTARITVTNQYDLVGNVRRTTSSYPNLAYPQYGNQTNDYWFRYDSMNRMVVANGALESGAIVRGFSGVEITYDAAGRRRTATHGASMPGYAYVWVQDSGSGGLQYEYEQFPIEGGNGHYEYRQINYWGARREEYEYRADGYLMNIRFADEGYYDDGNGNVVGDGSIGTAVLRGQNLRDAMGRVTQYLEYDVDGATVTQNRYNIVYDARGLILSESVSQRKTESGVNNTYLTHTANSYGAGGTLSWTSADNYRNGSDSAVADTYMSYGYSWWDDARVSTSSFDSDTGTSSNAIWTSTYGYDGLGRLAYVNIADGRPRTVSFADTPGGQVLRRTERSAAAKNPEDQYYFLDGLQIGELTSNGNNDPSRIDYSQTLQTRNWTNNPVSAPFRWNTSGGVTYGQFGGSGYDPISPLSNGMESTDGRVSVREGDTLQSIAAAQWGDASLWYMLAEANGLTGAESLAAGTSLIVPAKVTNLHNSARTFEVYDPNRALGDLSPTAAKPPKKAHNKCGVFGAVLLVVVAVAVAAIVGPAVIGTPAVLGTGGAVTTAATGLTAAFGGAAAAAGSAAAIGAAVVGGAIAGAAGSIASQGFGVAMGLQDKFSWKGVAMAAISGGVGGGLGAAFPGGGVLGAAARGAASSAITQGIGVATGLQRKFDWAGVAAAGISAGVGQIVGKALGVQSFKVDRSAGNIAANSVTSAARAIANAAARSLIGGTDFGDNILAALPDAIGQTIGDFIADSITTPETLAARTQRLSREANTAFRELTLTTPGQAVLRLAGLRNDAPTAADLLNALGYVPAGMSAAEATDAFGRRISDWLDKARSAAAQAPGATDESIAMNQNLALRVFYAALATELPRFQWTAVGGIVAGQVGQEIDRLGDYAAGAGLTRGLPLIGPITGYVGPALFNHVIGRLIQGQIDVVTDIGKYALAYRAFGAEAVANIAPNRNVQNAFRLQARSDSAFQRGDFALSASLGRDAAFALGVHEQIRLQTMWDDDAVRTLAQSASGMGMVSTDIRTPIGVISTPQGLQGGPWNLDYRIEVARNAFNYMHNNLFAPTAPVNNITVMRNYFNGVIEGRLRWANPQLTRT